MNDLRAAHGLVPLQGRPTGMAEIRRGQSSQSALFGYRLTTPRQILVRPMSGPEASPQQRNNRMLLRPSALASSNEPSLQLGRQDEELQAIC